MFGSGLAQTRAGNWARVQIENLTWQECIRRYDRPHTLYCIDPPYHGHEEDYGKGMFTRAEFEELAALPGTLKGSFILAINDTPEIRQTFAGMRTEKVKTRYTAARRKEGQAEVTELLITSQLPAAG